MLGDRYSAIVAILKVMLLLAALALLSTFFLLLRAPEPNAALRHIGADVEYLSSQQRLSQPRFAGTLNDGRALILNAKNAITDPNDSSTIAIQEINGVLNLSSNDLLMITANKGEMDTVEQVVNLDGSVNAVSLSGYRLMSESLTISLDAMRMIASGPVTINGGGTTLEAGAMDVTSIAEASLVHFSGGVRVKYKFNGYHD